MSDLHPAVAAVLAETPIDPDDGTVIIRWEWHRTYNPDCDEEYGTSIWGDPEPIAARQAVAVLRWLAEACGSDGNVTAFGLTAIAREIEAEFPTEQDGRS